MVTMIELARAIPDPNVLLALEPEELGAKMLFLLRKRKDQGQFNPSIILDELNGGLAYNPQPSYPSHQKAVTDAIIEAWAWLEAQGLIVPVSTATGIGSLRRMSRRAMKFDDEAEFAHYEVARRLPKESLNPRIQKKVWMAFMRGDFDVAVFQAMKAVEVAVRAATNIPKLGVTLMRAAFAVEGGPLTDMTVEAGEREARMHLFAGAIGSYKNPHSHRDVPLDDAAEATEVILLANHLLRIVDNRCRAREA